MPHSSVFALLVSAYFNRMPASSAIDAKGRIMGGGISAVARRKGSVHRLSESWDVGDYGKKESDRQVKRGRSNL